MIVVRDVFRLQFGKAREATELWKRAVGILQQAGFGNKGLRLLTDLAGAPYYTIVLEGTYESLGDWERAHQAVRGDEQWRSVYEQITAITEEGRREILSVVS